VPAKGAFRNSLAAGASAAAAGRPAVRFGSVAGWRPRGPFLLRHAGGTALEHGEEGMADPWLAREEYIALQQEVRGATAELARLERTCVLAVAALFAWLVRGAGDYAGYEGLVWLLPIIVPLYGSLKAWAVHGRLRLLGNYLVKQEARATPGEERWQAYFAREHSGARTAVMFAAWALFLALTVAGSALGFADFREQCPGPLGDACLQDSGSDSQTGA